MTRDARWPDDGQLVLSAITLGPATSLPERIAAAAAAGFTGIGLRPSDRRRALADGETDQGLRALLRDRAIEVVEVQALGNWGLGGEAGAQARLFEDELYALVDALGGRYVIAVGEIEGTLDDVVARFAAVCDRAARHGLSVALEFVPWTSIPDAGAAWAIVERAGRANAGVIVDAWHHFRGAADESLLAALPPDRVVTVHLSDAATEVVGTLKDDARHRRRLPGEGSFALCSFLDLLEAQGVRAPLAVEVLSDVLHARPAGEAAAAAATATRTVLARRRG